jgi:hypothetical protein
LEELLVSHDDDGPLSQSRNSISSSQQKLATQKEKDFVLRIEDLSDLLNESESTVQKLQQQEKVGQ